MTNLSIRIYSFITGLVHSAKDESGQDLVEYAVLVGFIGVAAAFALFLLMPDAMSDFTTKIKGCLAFDSANCTLG